MTSGGVATRTDHYRASARPAPADLRPWVAALERRAPYVLGGLVLLAAAVRLAGLTVEPLHIDEARQVAVTSRGVSAIVAESWQQNQPPLDHLIGWATTQVTGHSVFSSRLPSAVWGTAAVAFFFLALRRLSGAVPATVAGLVLALLPMHVAFSQYSRPYALPIAAFGAGLWLVSAYLDDGGRLRLAGVAAGGLLLPWTRALEGTAGLVALFIFLAIAALARVGSPRRAVEAGIALAAGLVSVAIVVPRLLADAGDYNQSQGLAPGQVWGTLRGMTELLLVAGGVVAALILVAGVSGALYLAWRDRAVPPAAAALLASLALVTASSYAILYRSNIPLADRYGTFFAPAVTVASALAVDALLRAVDRPRARMAAAFVVAAAVTALAIGTVVRTVDVGYPAFGPAARRALATGVSPDSVVVYQPGPLNQFRPAYPELPDLPDQPQSRFRAPQWISVDGRGLQPHEVPVVIWIPPVDTEDWVVAELAGVEPPTIDGYQRISVARGAGEVYVPEPGIARTGEDILQELSGQDPTTGRAWALLGAANLARLRGDLGAAAELIRDACRVAGPDTQIDLGSVFGRWDQPALSFRDFVVAGGLPAGGCV